MIEDFAVVRAFAGFAAAVSARLHWRAVLQPIDHVEIVNVLLDNVITAEPDEVIPVAQLILHFGQLAAVLTFKFRAWADPRRVAIPISAHRHDVADLAILKALDALNVAGVMMPLQTDANFEILLLRFLRRREEAAHACAVNGHRLLGEDVLALANSFFELHWAESGRRREDHHIALRDDFLVSIETHELAVVRYFNFGRMFPAQFLQAALHPIFVDITDGDELDTFTRADRLIGGAGAAAAATDESDFQRVAGRSAERETFDGQCAEERGTRDTFGAGGKKIPACDRLRGRNDFVHGFGS